MPDRPRLTPATADVRRAVRASLPGHDEGDLVLVALSGGPDSLALAAGVAFEAPRAELRAGVVIVDQDEVPGTGRAVEVAVGQRAQVGGRRSVHRAVVVEEGDGLGAEPGDVLDVHAVAGLPVVEGEREPLCEALRGVDLLGAGDLGDVVVLHPGEVPDQPADRVGPRRRGLGELVDGQAVDGPGDHALDVVEGGCEQFVDAHASWPTRLSTPVNR